MAAHSTQKPKIVCSCLIVFILFTFAADLAEARRGGGGRGGGGRGRSSSRSKSSSNKSKPKTVKNYGHVALSGRIVKGSSPYNKNNWRAAAAGGLILGGAWYLSRHRHRSDIEMPTICTNNYDIGKYDNFICPLESKPDNETYCCGPEKREYCCDKLTAQKYYADNESSSSSLPAGIIIGIIALIIIICLAVYACKNRKKIKKWVKKNKKGRRDSHRSDDNGMTLHQTGGVPYVVSGMPPPYPHGAGDPGAAPYPPASTPYPAGSAPYPPPYHAGGDNPAPYPPVAYYPSTPSYEATTAYPPASEGYNKA